MSRYNQLWFRFQNELTELRTFTLTWLDIACYELLPRGIMPIISNYHRVVGGSRKLTKYEACLLLLMFYDENKCISPSKISDPNVRAIASKLGCLKSRRTNPIVYTLAEARFAVPEAADSAA